MKYTARITLSLISVFVSSAEFFIESAINSYELIFNALMTILAWYVGGLVDKFVFLSQKDFLTKVYNRRFIDKRMPKMLKRAQRKNHPLCLFLIDVNNFKQLNDTYGHFVGDQVLEKVAKILLSYTNKKGIVARWGGDEFIIIAPYIDKSTAHEVSNQLKTVVDDWIDRKGFKEKEVSIGIAIGFAIFPNEAITFDKLLTASDKKMYMDKIYSKQIVK